jgi:hypothetical protein
MEQWQIRTDGLQTAAYENEMEARTALAVAVAGATEPGVISLWYATCYNDPDVWDAREIESVYVEEELTI